jgi:3-dehydroquinate synthase
MPDTLSTLHTSINYPAKSQQHNLQIGYSLQNAVIDACQQINQHVAIISDDNVAHLYGMQLQQQLVEHGLSASLFTFPAGEQSKIRSTKEALEDAMIARGIGRDTTVIGLGGGVTTDLTSFIAATYCRGLPLLLLPTTLLAMVDAAIGGKAAVDHSMGKNLIGVFYSPHAIYCDLNALQTLQPLHRRHGLAEMIKHGLIANQAHYIHLEQHTTAYINGKKTLNADLIQTSCRIKLDVVSKDPYEETGARRILNFGHTFAHAFEKISGYHLQHGDAVMLGMLLEARCAYIMDALNEQAWLRLARFLLPYAIDIAIKNPLDLSSEHLWKSMSSDKKSQTSLPRIVLLNTIGSVHSCDGKWCELLPYNVLSDTLNWFEDALCCH